MCIPVGCHVHIRYIVEGMSFVICVIKLLTLVRLSPDIPYLFKQCRSRSVGFWRSQLIWICTVCHQVCEFIAKIQIKQYDWLKIRSGCGILIYSAGQGFLMLAPSPVRRMCIPVGYHVHLRHTVEGKSLLLLLNCWCWLHLLGVEKVFFLASLFILDTQQKVCHLCY